MTNLPSVSLQICVLRFEKCNHENEVLLLSMFLTNALYDLDILLECVLVLFGVVFQHVCQSKVSLLLGECIFHVLRLVLAVALCFCLLSGF